MLVTMIGEISGSRDGVPWPPIGGSIDLPEDEAMNLIANRMAIPTVDPERGVERAVVDAAPVETRAAARKSLVK